MVLPINRPGVQALISELEPLVLGKEHEGFSCGCGAVHCDTAVAVRIEPAGDSYPGQEVLWYTWSVEMKAHHEAPGWSSSLSSFVPGEMLDTMFRRHFGDRDRSLMPFRLNIRGMERIEYDLPAAVRIRENDALMDFSFDWGRDQRTGTQIGQLGYQRITAGSQAWNSLLTALQALRPEAYRGGPDPVLPFESAWRLDYDTALAQAAAEAPSVLIRGATTSNQQGMFYTDTEVTFTKPDRLRLVSNS